jgi:tetrahydromethanopterin:alpha-L-glutamate ligase
MPHSPDSVVHKPAAPQLRVALVGDRVDWHARELVGALAGLGARAIPVRLEDFAFTTDTPFAVHVPGFDGSLPDAVFVRSMSGGSFEAVTLRLGFLHALRETGVLVCNDARAIERCVDKSMTSFLLAHAGIRSPTTWVTESRAAAQDIVQREVSRGPLVLKPLFGSQGRNLRLIRTAADLPAASAVAGGVYYLQRFLGVERDGAFRDFRLLVWQGRVVAAMMRHAPHWITNVKRGGRPVAVVADRAMTELALRAAAAVGADFAGVDILRGGDGQPTVLEVNSMPAWSGLQKVTTLNIAAVVAAGLIATLSERAQRGATG